MIDIDALSVNGRSPLVDKISDCDSQISVVISDIENILNNTIDTAISEYNKLQNKYNEELERKMASQLNNG